MACDCWLADVGFWTLSIVALVALVCAWLAVAMLVLDGWIWDRAWR